MAQQFTKQPSEQYPIAIEFSGRLPTGTSLSSGTVSAIEDTADSSNASTVVLSSTTATISGTQAKVTVKAGVDGKKYKITFLVTLNDGSKLEEDIIMTITEE